MASARAHGLIRRLWIVQDPKGVDWPVASVAKTRDDAIWRYEKNLNEVFTAKHTVVAFDRVLVGKQRFRKPGEGKPKKPLPPL